MSQPPDRKVSVSDWLKDRYKRGLAFARTGTGMRLAILVMLGAAVFLFFLIYSSEVLQFSTRPLQERQEMRLTRNPYTSTPTATATKKASLTPTPTFTPTLTGTLTKPRKTPIIFTATFTHTPTATRPSVPLVAPRSDQYLTWRERLTDSWLWHHLYALFVGVGLASWLMALYLRDIYGFRRVIRSAGLLRRIILLLPVGTIRVRGGNFIDVVYNRRSIPPATPQAGSSPARRSGTRRQRVSPEVRIVGRDWMLFTPDGRMVRRNGKPVTADGLRRTFRLLRVGFPARLIVETDSCVVIEGRQKQSLVCGPTGGAVALLGFSRIRCAVDLRDTQITISVCQPTRDGILLNAEDVELVFSVTRGSRRAPGTDYSYDEDAIFNLVYRYWLDGEWLDEMSARIAAELRSYITGLTVTTFLPYLSQGEGLPSNMNQASNPFNAFVQSFNLNRQPQCGIQIHWLGRGRWTLASEIKLDEQMGKWQQDIDRLLDLPASFSPTPAGGEFDQALTQLIRQVPLGTLDQWTLDDQPVDRSLMRQVIEAYRDRLVRVMLLYQQNGQTPPPELMAAIDHLNLLLLRRIGGAG